VWGRKTSQLRVTQTRQRAPSLSPLQPIPRDWLQLRGGSTGSTGGWGKRAASPRPRAERAWRPSLRRSWHPGATGAAEGQTPAHRDGAQGWWFPEEPPRRPLLFPRAVGSVLPACRPRGWRGPGDGRDIGPNFSSSCAISARPGGFQGPRGTDASQLRSVTSDGWLHPDPLQRRTRSVPELSSYPPHFQRSTWISSELVKKATPPLHPFSRQ